MEIQQNFVAFSEYMNFMERGHRLTVVNRMVYGIRILETYHYFVACMLMMIAGWTFFGVGLFSSLFFFMSLCLSVCLSV